MRNIYIAGFGGTYLEAILVDPDRVAVYNMNSYATFHGLDHGQRQVMGGHSTCYDKDSKEATRKNLLNVYKARVHFVDGRFYRDRDTGYFCKNLRISDSGEVTAI